MPLSQVLSDKPQPSDTPAKPLATSTDTPGNDVSAKPIDSNPYGKSTLQSHPWDNAKSLRYQPVSILFLTGDYANQILDLGYNVLNLKEDQPFGWEVLKTRGVRSGVERVE